MTPPVIQIRYYETYHLDKHLLCLALPYPIRLKIWGVMRRCTPLVLPRLGTAVGFGVPARALILWHQHPVSNPKVVF
jgi:hypothetical protein